MGVLERGGIEFLSDLFIHNSELFGLDFVELLITKVDIEVNQDGISTLSRLPIFQLARRTEKVVEVNTFLLDVVKKNKNTMNEVFVNALCESIDNTSLSSLWVLCCNVREHRFVDYLLKSLASPKLEKCRELVIKTLCRESGSGQESSSLVSPLRMLAGIFYYDENNQILKLFIAQYIKLFEPKLLGETLSSNAYLSETNLLTFLCDFRVGKEILSIIFDKLPAVKFHINPEALDVLRKKKSGVALLKQYFPEGATLRETPPGVLQAFSIFPTKSPEEPRGFPEQGKGTMPPGIDSKG